MSNVKVFLIPPECSELTLLYRGEVVSTRENLWCRADKTSPHFLGRKVSGVFAADDTWSPERTQQEFMDAFRNMCYAHKEICGLFRYRYSL